MVPGVVVTRGVVITRRSVVTPRVVVARGVAVARGLVVRLGAYRPIVFRVSADASFAAAAAMKATRLKDAIRLIEHLQVDFYLTDASRRSQVAIAARAADPITSGCSRLIEEEPSGNPWQLGFARSMAQVLKTSRSAVEKFMSYSALAALSTPTRERLLQRRARVRGCAAFCH